MVYERLLALLAFTLLIGMWIGASMCFLVTSRRRGNFTLTASDVAQLRRIADMAEEEIKAEGVAEFSWEREKR